MNRLTSSGFSMMELMVVLVVAGILIAVTIPAYKRFTQSNDLKGASRAVATQLALGRERAIATGTTQTLRFMKNYGGTSDYHVWSNNTASPSWKLPKGVTYVWGPGTKNTYRMSNDGRCQDAGMLVLENDKGDRDTVSVRLSGLVLVY